MSRALLAALIVATSVVAAAAAPCPLMPAPKVFQERGQDWQLAGPDAAAIVVGAQATAPEQYAAERFQGLVKRRYKQTLPIVTEEQARNAASPGLKQLFLFGQRSTHTWIDGFCRDRKIDLNETSPGFDGFVIECFEQDGRRMVIVGGCNPRGVIYGQDALFDLIRAEGDRVVFPAVSVRDWPSIAWRGRPHSVLQHHLVPGALDAYLRARINFTDVRDNPKVAAGSYFAARKASMGFPPGIPVDRPPVQRMIAESHRRGLFVYGTVSCGEKNARIEDVLYTFHELVELGVDGLWISFDDTGAGDRAEEIVRRVLAFGKEHNMIERKIAITPPDPDYKLLDTPFDRKIAAIPGMESAQWMFTRVPCAADVTLARDIGLKRLPGWWHNLEGFSGGFLHNGGVLCTLRADLRPAYVNLQPLRCGWGKPEYATLRSAARYTDCALLWCVCNGWPEEYEIAAFGHWAWNPETHDWAALRGSAYRYVYGADQAAAARDFDDKLAQLKSLYHLPQWEFMPNKGWPCRLKNVQDRSQALALIDELQTLAQTLTDRSPAQTAIDPARLESVYLEPMRTTLVFARKMTLLDYPEDAQAGLDERMLRLVRKGQLEKARETLNSVKPQVERQLHRIADELCDLKGIDGYAAYWRQRLTGVEYWQKLARQRRAQSAK